MDESLVFAKTAKGVIEVSRRSGGLSMTARRVLIMIDGKRTVGELAPLASNGGIDAVIGLLESQGFVQPAAPPDPNSPGAPRAPDPGPTTTAGLDVLTSGPGGERTLLTVDEVKRRAVRELTERLGPDAETMAIRIEPSRSAEELRVRLREAERLVAGFLGEPSAQEFIRALRRR
ncbi:MAG TPA: hypothetical protein VF229_07385 [Burkholderiaceae bacterium]